MYRGVRYRTPFIFDINLIVNVLWFWHAFGNINNEEHIDVHFYTKLKSK